LEDHLNVMQQGSGTLVLTGSNTYTEGTTISDGTLCVGDGETSGTLGSGAVAVGQDGLLVFDRSDTVTVSNPISGQGDLSQEGSGTLILTDEVSLASATISGGTLQVEGSVRLSGSLTNLATLGVVGTGSVTHGTTRIAGTAAALSAGEVVLDSTGLGIGSTALTFEISTDGVNYYPIVYGDTTDAQTLLSGLHPNTNYYLRSRATYLVQGQERYGFYDGGMVTTAQGPGSGEPDTAGWYRVVAIRPRSGYGPDLTANSGSTAYVYRDALPESTAQVLSPRDGEVHVFGDTSLPPLGSEEIFLFDRSWYFAESPQAAILQAVIGLVYDQSVPTVTNGVIGEIKGVRNPHFLRTLRPKTTGGVAPSMTIGASTTGRLRISTKRFGFSRTVRWRTTTGQLPIGEKENSTGPLRTTPRRSAWILNTSPPTTTVATPTPTQAIRTKPSPICRKRSGSTRNTRGRTTVAAWPTA
jgi:autotransporter-associated beta strand protein